LIAAGLELCNAGYTHHGGDNSKQAEGYNDQKTDLLAMPYPQ